MSSTVPKKIDWSKIANRSVKPLSTQEALKDVIPFEWDDDVINGKTKIVVKKYEESTCVK